MDVWSAVFLLVLLSYLPRAAGQDWDQSAFRVEPRNQTVRLGSTALLRCEVVQPSGAVQWVKDGLLLGPQRDLPGFPRYSMLGNPQRGVFHLQVRNASLVDDGRYECQVGGSESSGPISSNSAWLDVLIPPSKPYLEVDLAEPWVTGRRYPVVCVGPDAKPEAQLQLYKDGVELMGAESLTMSGSDDKLWTTRTHVTVLALSSDHGRLLTCVARNPALLRPKETSVPMQVYFPPQAPVLQGVEGGEVRGGEVMRLVCVSQGGNPPAALTWMKDGEVLSTTWQQDQAGGRSSSTLRIRVSPADNRAELCCQTLNLAMSSPFSVSMKVTVLFEPAEVSVLGSFAAVEGGEVSLSCVASDSNPPVSLRWWLGARELNASTLTLLEGANGGSSSVSNLTHRVTREADGLPLTCEAFNPGTRFSQSRTENLVVFYPPLKVWLEAPPPKPLPSGTKVRLVCFSSGGNPQADLTWLKDGRPVSGALAPVAFEKGVYRELVLVLGPGDNMATYRCDACNKAMKVRSAQTRLLVQFPAVSVKILDQQEDLRAGENLSLQCVSGSSNPQASISWSLGALRLPGVERPPQTAAFGGVSVSSTLSLRLRPRYNRQRLLCRAYSAALAEGTSTFYTLNVLYPPEFSPNQPEQVQVVEDDTVIIPLLVSGNPEEISCTWLHRKKTLVPGRDLRYDWLEGNSLQIRNVSRRDGGRYSVSCSNQEGEQRTAMTLDVQYGPDVAAQRGVAYADLGGVARLVCVADANPEAIFSWSWLGEGEVELGEESQEEEVGVLTLRSVGRSHAGRYRCTADNGVAPPGSAELQLVVRFGPEVQKGVQWTRVASRGDGSGRAELVCRAEGVPPVSFSWTKNNVSMDFANPRYLQRVVRDGAFSTSTMVVLNVSALLDYGEFTCSASNALGADTLHIQLTSTHPPDPPSSLCLLGVTHNSVTLDWMPGFHGGLEQSFRIRYRGPQGDYTYVDVSPPAAAMFTVTGLAPLTTYSFSVGARNAVGESGYADGAAPLSATTQEWWDPAGPDEDPGPPSRPADWAAGWTLMAAVLLACNSLCCWLGWRWRRIQTGRSRASDHSSVWDERKSVEMGSRLSGGLSSSRYESREKINAAAQRTGLDSETQSNVYESYAAESHISGPSHLHRPPGRPYAEEHCRPANTDAETPGHEYEAVPEFGWYQDTRQPPPSQPPPSQPPPSFHHSLPLPADRPEQGSRGIRRTAEDRLFLRDYDLPFELRGELV